MKAVVIKEFGGPEVMAYDEIKKPEPQPHEVLIKIEAAGINYIDTYQRSGMYPIELPATLGLEAAGVVEGLGKASTQFKTGDRVAFTNVLGAYAEYAVVDENKVVRVPDSVTSEQAAASLLQGCTAYYLSHATFKLNNHCACLIHAGAGGVGLLLTQIAKNIGAYIITTVSTPEKAELSRAAGADEVINYTEKDFAEEIKRITKGKGVDVVYDSVGKSTFEKSLDSLKTFGTMVLYGNSSGPVTQFNPASLASKGSLYLTRPTLFDHISDPVSLRKYTSDFFALLNDGKVKLRTEHKYPLSEAVEAHRALEGRKTTGKILLIP